MYHGAMATQSQALTAGGDPVNLVTTLTLSAGTTVSVQNVGLGTVFLAEAAAEPDPAMGPPAHVLERLMVLGIEVGSEGIWVWSPAQKGLLAVTEQ